MKLAEKCKNPVPREIERTCWFRAALWIVTAKTGPEHERCLSSPSTGCLWRGTMARGADRRVPADWSIVTKHVTGDVIVLLPGILGSVLEREGQEVWAPTAGSAWRAIRSLGRSVRDLELADDSVKDDVLTDGVRATRLVPDVHLIPGFWGIDGYSGISKMILDNFELKPGHYLEFPYDWRRDLRAAARQLGERVEPLLAADPDARLVLVAHSLGGLVARYYLECLDGWKRARMLVSFGTPYRGSVNALNFIANGFLKTLGPFKVDLSPFMRSCNSVYQLLPIYPCIDAGGKEDVRAAESTGVPFLDTVRATSALSDFHRAIEAGVERRPEKAYEIHPVVGLTQPTRQSAVLAGGMLTTREARGRGEGAHDESGDGTVPRVSATPIELGDDPPAVYAAQKHASLQNVGNVQTQLLGLWTRVPGLSTIKDARAGLALSVAELFVDTEPITLAVTPEVFSPGIQLFAHLVDLGRNVTAGPFPLTEGDDGAYTVELPPRAAGDYRITVAGHDKSSQLVQPVSDVIMVAPEDPDSKE